jgi:hypothetical protein
MAQLRRPPRQLPGAFTDDDLIAADTGETRLGGEHLRAVAEPQPGIVDFEHAHQGACRC